MIASELLPQEFNAATYFVDRNVAEGRGSRPAFFYEDRVAHLRATSRSWPTAPATRCSSSACGPRTAC